MIAATALLLAACGSGPPPRKAAAIEACLQAGGISFSPSRPPGLALPTKLTAVLPRTILFVPAHPTLAQQIKGEATIIRLYPSDDTAQRRFQADRASAPEALYANVIVTLPLARTAATRQVEACAFGRRAQPQVASG